jgi:hypothetical protein
MPSRKTTGTVHPIRPLNHGGQVDRLRPNSLKQMRTRQVIVAGTVAGLMTVGIMAHNALTDSSPSRVTAAGSVLPSPETFGAKEAHQIIADIESGREKTIIPGQVEAKGPLNLRTTPRITPDQAYDDLASGFGRLQSNVGLRLDDGDERATFDRPHYVTTEFHGDWLVVWEEQENGTKKFYFVSTAPEAREQLTTSLAGGLPNIEATEPGDYGRLIRH